MKLQLIGIIGIIVSIGANYIKDVNINEINYPIEARGLKMYIEGSVLPWFLLRGKKYPIMYNVNFPL